MIDLTTLQATLDAAGEAYEIVALQSGAMLCVTQRGGRILGLFAAEDAPNLLWVNADALTSKDHLAQFKAANGWNLGGERVWIAPEIQYIIRDRTDFWGTHTLPAAIDPGNYALSRNTDGSVMLSQSITLAAYNLAQGDKALDIERRIYPIDDPLRSLSDYETLIDDVQFIGYAQSVTLIERNATPIISESWNLVQLQPGGILYIPVMGAVDGSDYFGDVPDEARRLHDDSHLRLNITGKQQYKIGYKATCMTGRMAYFNTLADGRAYLLVRHFNNNPSAVYSEEPPESAGNNGYSVHVYNDGGGFGGFGEMECSGQAIGSDTGRQSSTDVFQMWAYVGASNSLKSILHRLIGVRL